MKRMKHTWNLLRNYFVIVIIVLLELEQVCECNGDGEVCNGKADGCQCEFSDGTSIDLTKLFQNNSDASVYLSDKQLNVTVYYHGCKDIEFKLPNLNVSMDHCRDPASICVYNATDQAMNALAVAKEGTFSSGGDDFTLNPALTYKQNGFSTVVSLVCTPFYKKSHVNIAEISSDGKIYKLELVSPHACRTSLPHGLSTGSKLLIMFFTFLLVYFIGGAALAYFLRGARGRELVPNVDFWTNLPGLVKDGVIFLIGGCSTRLVTTAETYDQI